MVLTNSRVDYERRAASQPSVSRSPSPARRTPFAMYPALRRPRQTSAAPLRASFCTLGIGPIGPCSVYTEYSSGFKTPRSPASLRHVDGFPVLRLHYGGSAPTSVLPWSPQLACIITGRRDGVPMFPFLTPGWLGFCFTPGGPGGRDKKEWPAPRYGFSRTFQMGP
jgi:hypothetical protein